jgi:pimeloyl-ACP methyl ester carboxylesterase
MHGQIPLRKEVHSSNGVEIMAQELKLPDGRIVEYTVTGPDSGRVLLWHHGTPGALTPLPNLLALCTKKNFRLITLSRSGYGGSSRHKGRRVVDAVADSQSLLEHLNIAKCYVGGWSGGG